LKDSALKTVKPSQVILPMCIIQTIRLILY